MQLSAKAAQLSLQNIPGLQRENCSSQHHSELSGGAPLPLQPLITPDLEPVKGSMKKWMRHGDTLAWKLFFCKSTANLLL